MPYLYAAFAAAVAFGSEIVDQIPEDLRDRGNEIVETVKANPVLLNALLVVAVLTAGLFVFGIVRQLFKAALFGGLASAATWYWYFNIR